MKDFGWQFFFEKLHEFDWQFFFEKLHEFVFMLKMPQLIEDDEI